MLSFLPNREILSALRVSMFSPGVSPPGEKSVVVCVGL